MQGPRRVLALSLLLLPFGASSQTAAESGKALIEAKILRKWTTMAESVDSAGLAVIRAFAAKTIDQMSLLAQLEVRQQVTNAGADGPLKLIDATRSMLGGSSLLQLAFAGVTDTGTLRALPDKELAARWFQAKDPAYASRLVMNGMLSGVLASRPDGDQLRAEIDAGMNGAIVWQLVSVAEDRFLTNLAHVIYRIGTGPATGVLTLRQVRGRWYLATVEDTSQLEQLSKLEMSARMRAQR